VLFVTFVFGKVTQDPFFDPKTDVNFLLFTRNNPKTAQRITFLNIESIRTSNFDANKEVRFIVHGWLQTGNSGFSPGMKDAFLRALDINVVIVDWGAGANSIDYISSVRRVPGTGRVIAKLVDFLSKNFNLNFEKVSMVGHSLGAHIVGFAGKQLQKRKINVLYGLDPAGPLFDINNPSTRISSGDARYVEIIHTDIGIVGMGGHLGDASFFPNGGANQPGCFPAGDCSHLRSTEYLIESLSSNNFIARSCSTIDDARNSRCTGNSGFIMGGDPSVVPKNLSGIFHLRTNSQSPFAVGSE
jgi:pimeloyl-ACP methyl ester carboxylesterase